MSTPNSKIKDIKEVLNIILTVVLIICALVIISLLMINFISPKSHTIKKTQMITTSGPSYHLPEVLEIRELDDINKLYEDIQSKPIRGFPVAVEFCSIISVANREMLFLPILMEESELYGILSFGMIDPLRWENKNQFSECIIGRRSIWYMPVGSLMLYGILIEPQLEYRKVGLGFVLVKRIDELTYDVLLQDKKGMILYAARGRIEKINKNIGQGTLIPLEDQDVVKETYKPKWDIKPENFLLFSNSHQLRNF